MSDFPTRPEDLTAQWLGASLGCDVESFVVELLGEGAGLLGQVTRVRLEYARTPGTAETKRPASLIAKFPTPTPENRVVAETFDMYAKEVRFYRGLASQTPARAPGVYRAELDEASSDFVLLLEDLSSCRVGDQREGCGLEDANRAIAQIVKLHTTWWGRTESPELGWIPVHDNPTQCAGISQGFAAGWEIFARDFGDVMPVGLADQYAKIGPQTADCLARLCGGALTVVHGDFRLDNLFFDVDDDPDLVAMFDWQGISKSCGPQDLGYFMSQSLRSEVRREHQEALVRSYWEQLCDQGVSGYSFDQCWQDYRCAVLYLFTYAVVIAGTLDHSNERGVAMVHALASRSAETVHEVEALELLRP